MFAGYLCHLFVPSLTSNPAHVDRRPYFGVHFEKTWIMALFGVGR